MNKSFEDLATRHNNGRASFVECVCRTIDVNNKTAEKICDLYIKERILKIEYTIGQFKVKHGAFLDADVLQNAAEMVS